MLYRFKHFHPLNGLPPEALSWHGTDVVVRARELLKDRKIKEIKAALNIVNWMIDSSVVRDETFSRLSELAEEGGKHAACIEILEGKRPNRTVKVLAESDVPCARNEDSSVFTLRLCKTIYDISGYDEFANATWHELFAVLALGLIEKACSDEKYYGSWNREEHSEWLHEWRIETHVSDLMIEAMDAVATAEGLLREITAVSQAKEKILEDTKMRLSIRNQAAGIQRHAETTDALHALFDFYLAGNFKSLRNAAQIFTEKFPVKVAHLAPTNRLRTLSEGLSKLLKVKNLDKFDEQNLNCHFR